MEGVKLRVAPYSLEAHTPNQLKEIWAGKLENCGQQKAVENGVQSEKVAPAKAEGPEGSQQLFPSWDWFTKDDRCAF